MYFIHNLFINVNFLIILTTLDKKIYMLYNKSVIAE